MNHYIMSLSKNDGDISSSIKPKTDKQSDTLHETTKTKQCQIVETPWPDHEFYVMDRYDTTPEILEQAMTNCGNFKSVYLKCRDALRERIARGEEDEVFNKLKPYPKALAKYILEAVGEDEYYPSFLIEDEICFLEIIDLCRVI